MGQQLTDVFIKITSKFRPMNLPVDYVWQCTSVLARYIVGNGDATHCDENGDPQVPTWTPGLVEVVSNTSTITLTYDIEMLVDSQAGLDVTIDGIAATILGVDATDEVVAITLTDVITAGQVVLVSYNSTTGSIRSNAIVPVDALSFNDLNATNVTV